MDRNDRYDHADEVMEACDALWNSWDADAIVYDRKRGIYAEPSKVHYADYQGKWVKTRGPLPTPRSPQGRPVIMQAGSSERGRQFAARWAEVIFTLQHSRPDMQAFYSDIKTRMEQCGRNPEDCIITPAVDIVLGETESIAHERAEYLNSLVSAEVGVCDISNANGIDLSQYPLDQRLQDMAISDGARGVLDVVLQGTRAGDLTLRQAGYRYGINQLTPTLIGTPEMVADRLQEMFELRCCDGFRHLPVNPAPGGTTTCSSSRPWSQSCNAAASIAPIIMAQHCVTHDSFKHGPSVDQISPRYACAAGMTMGSSVV